MNDHAISPCQNSSAHLCPFLTRFLRRDPYRSSAPSPAICGLGRWPWGTPRLLGARLLGNQVIPIIAWGLAKRRVPFFSSTVETTCAASQAILVEHSLSKQFPCQQMNRSSSPLRWTRANDDNSLTSRTFYNIYRDDEELARGIHGVVLRCRGL